MHDDMTEIAILTLIMMCCTCTLEYVEMLNLIFGFGYERHLLVLKMQKNQYYNFSVAFR